MQGFVAVDGAAVYSKPDFDAPVAEYLDYQTKITIARKATAGIGGMGLFHYVRYGGGKTGYILDTDLKVAKGEAKKAPKTAGKKKKSKSKMWEEEEQAAMGDAPIFFKRYFGGALAMVNFTEKFTGQEFSDEMLMYGIRMIGPGTLFDGPPLDFNLWFSVDKPGYHKKFASGDSNGFLLFGDVMMMLPFYEAKKTVVSGGLGVMWTYTSYRIPVRGDTYDSQEFRFGLDLGLGVSQAIGKKLILRGDVKYYYEKTDYFGYMLSVMGEY